MTHLESGVPVNDAWGVTYNPAGQMTALAYKGEGGIEYNETFTYNARNQLTNLNVV